MDVKLAPDWQVVLEEETQKDYFGTLMKFVETEYDKHLCFPPKEQIFAAFQKTPFQEVKIVLLGQDPYHGVGQANGLSFSVNEGVSIPPSLRNIKKEIELEHIPSTIQGDLSSWADQGVLLLNATLTVRAHQAASHQKQGWETFTNVVISKLSEKREHLVFLLWGGTAQRKERLIDPSKHLVLKSGHPSPMSANRGYWFGNRHFSKTNEYLIQKGKTPIVW
jgi:uracil-DNA glycosylase